MNPTDYQLRSPEYAQYYYKQAAEDNQRAYDQQQRAELAKWAKTSGYQGNEAVDYTGMPTTPGTGIHAEGFDPARRDMMLGNRALLMSGLDAAQTQGLSQMGSMQDSRNTGVNQINMEKWKKDNIPRKADTKFEQLIQYKNRMEPNDPNMQLVDAAINKEATRSKGVQFSSDGQGGFNFSQGETGGQLQLGTAPKNKSSAQIMSGAKQLNQMYRIGRDFKSEYMGLEGDVRAGIGSFTDYMFGAGPQAEFNANRGAFRRNVKQLFNDYKVEITGAAASDKEMSGLRDSILNEELGATAFKAAYDQFMEYATTNMVQNMKAQGLEETVIFNQLGFAMAKDSSGIMRVQMPNGDWIEVQE